MTSNASLNLARYVFAAFKGSPITSKTVTHEQIDMIALNLKNNGHDDVDGYDVRIVKAAVLRHEQYATGAFRAALQTQGVDAAYRAYDSALESEIS